MEWPFVSRKKYNDLVTLCSRQQKVLQDLEKKVVSQDDQINFTHNLYIIYRNLFAEAARRRDKEGKFVQRVPITHGGSNETRQR